MTNYWNGTKIREHEKLDGLWASGIRYYPVNGPFDDLYATTLDAAKKLYNIDEVTAFVTEQIRRFKPLVCVTQDINGEYGHGGHMLLAASVQTAVTSSMDESSVLNLYRPMAYGMFLRHTCICILKIQLQ